MIQGREKVTQRVFKYLGMNPNRITMNVDAGTTANISSITLHIPSQAKVARMLMRAGIQVRRKRGTVSIIYDHLFKRHITRIE